MKLPLGRTRNRNYSSLTHRSRRAELPSALSKIMILGNQVFKVEGILMKSLQELSALDASQSIMGMKATCSNLAIGRVVRLLYDENEFSGVEIQKDSDSSIIAVYRKRIEGVDEVRNVLIIN